MSGAVDVLAYHGALIEQHRALSADAYHAQELPKALEARAAVAELMAFAESALSYVDAAADVERERHRVNGAPKSQVLAEIVGSSLRAALARCGGAS